MMKALIWAPSNTGSGVDAFQNGKGAGMKPIMALPLLLAGGLLTGCPGDAALRAEWKSEKADRDVAYTFTRISAVRETAWYNGEDGMALVTVESGPCSVHPDHDPPRIDWTIQRARADRRMLRDWFENQYAAASEESLQTLYAEYEAAGHDAFINRLIEIFEEDLAAAEGETYLGVYAVQGETLLLDFSLDPERPATLEAAQTYTRQ
jgi:hypothetical protein